MEQNWDVQIYFLILLTQLRITFLLLSLEA